MAMQERKRETRLFDAAESFTRALERSRVSRGEPPEGSEERSSRKTRYFGAIGGAVAGALVFAGLWNLGFLKEYAGKTAGKPASKHRRTRKAA